MTEPSDYLRWFDARGLDNEERIDNSAPWWKTADQDGAPLRDPEMARLLAELSIDATGVNPSNLLRAIAGTGDAEAAGQRLSAKQSIAALA